MCYAWVKQKLIKEPTLDEIKTIFNDRVFKNNLKVINITGGEPTLRHDLPEIIKIILQSCVNLKCIDISTNGVNTQQVIDQIECILALLLPTNVKLTVSISLDGIYDTHERVRQTQGIFRGIDQTIDRLKELMELYPFFNLGLNMTISKLNYNAIEEVQGYAIRKKLGVSFTLSAISDIGVESVRMRDKFEMTQEEKNKVALSFKDLLRAGILDSEYARFLFTWLETGKRDSDCAFRRGKALLLEPSGDIYSCGNYKDFRIGNLLQVPLKESAFFNRNNLAKEYKIKCETCNSNCYIYST